MTETKVVRLRREFTAQLQQLSANPSREDLEGLVERLLAAVYPSRQVTAQNEMVGALSWVLGWEPALNYGRLGALGSELLDAGYTPQQVREWYSLTREEPAGSNQYVKCESRWRSNWRSRGGQQLPNDKDIRITIGQFKRESEGTATGFSVVEY